MKPNASTDPTTPPIGGQDAADALVEEVFLSPRVVDGATLGEFGSMLRELIVEAGRGRERLLQAIAETEGVVADLDSTASKASDRLRPAAKLITSIDEKLREAEEALSRAGGATQIAERAVSEAERAAEAAAKAATSESMQALHEAEEALGQAVGRAKLIDGRLSQAGERSEMAVEILERECKERLDGASSHAQDLLGTMIAELDARAEEAIARLGAMLDERRAAAEAAMGDVIEIAGTPETPTDALLDTPPVGIPEEALDVPETDASDGATRLARTIADLEARASEAHARVDAAIRRAEEAEKKAEIAESRLGAAEEQLRLIDERGREIAEGASHALGMFDQELSNRMRAVREMMEQLAQVPPGAPGQASSPTQPGAQARGFVRVDRPSQG